ncbi:MAG TPA: hypothetical protein VKA68_02275 [bacterium]|nr:hypothetical protein [bacterium]
METNNKREFTRRKFLKTTVVGSAGLLSPKLFVGQERSPGAETVEVLNPENKVPLSFIIDDSTCLVNMAYYGIPQFHAAFPDRYPQDWRRLPREIPDAFVREFGEWCRDHGVKGKYSIVPYPACVGWVDRFLPGWSAQELSESLALVRDFMSEDWDIHPEMISHTRVIDIYTGRPYQEASPEYMENWGWSQDKSAEVLTEYMAYALRILRNAGLYCEGITTPGGFGSQNRENLALGTREAVREVYNVDVPHYFRDLFTDPEQSVQPRVKLAEDLDSDDPKCVVSIIGCTGDWFGGWDGLTPGSVDRFITEDLQKGRLVEVIDQEEPAILVCHWPGIYYNGEKTGFNIFKEVVGRVHAKYENVLWMKLSEIARYWAAKELTSITRDGDTIALNAPFATGRFTLRTTGRLSGAPTVQTEGESVPLTEARSLSALQSGSWYAENENLFLCFDLSRGTTRITL